MRSCGGQVKIIELPPVKERKFSWRDYLIAVLILAGLMAAGVVVAFAAHFMTGPWW